MKVSSVHNFYNVDLSLYQIDHGSLVEAFEYVRNFCGGFVWCECETTQQAMPANAKYIDTYYNINVYYDFYTENFLFEEFE